MQGDVVIVAVHGDVDMATASELSATITRQFGPEVPVVLDCSQISFLDSMGLSALVEADRRAKAVGARLLLSGPSAPVRRVMELSGTEGYFELWEGPVSPVWPLAECVGRMARHAATSGRRGWEGGTGRCRDSRALWMWTWVC